MFKFIAGYKGAELLPQSPFRAGKGITIEDRKKVRVAIIDDEIFERRQQLSRLGYDFKELDDIKEIDEVSSFDIVLVDLMGVGVKFDTENQGAFLISEIRRNYPSLFVCAYSGSDKKSAMAINAKHIADAFISKDELIEELTEKLDNLSINASSPSYIWGRIRKSLVDEGVTTRNILTLEHEYATELLSQKPNSEKFITKTQAIEISQTARDILKSLAASFIFKAMGG